MIFECVILFLTLYTNWLIGVIFCLSYSPQLDLQQLTSTVERALGARANQYSRHGNTPPGSRPSSNTSGIYFKIIAHKELISKYKSY
jgi:hypothetical protein